ncbi:MAG: nucleotidyltransferase [Chloroflexi bacterium]|nr:nucleotidyltransferase [Chloroflexota bacterium]
MAIPKPQLSRWSHHGPQEASIRTHQAIRSALEAHSWPQGMTYDVYLQGSYKNDTNIRGDSDVDVVVQLTSAFRHDASLLSPLEQNQLDSTFSTALYDWGDFRRETLKALVNWFDNSLVAQGNKSIKIKANPPRLAADVVVCMEYRRYLNYYSYVEGITFWALQDKYWIINFPTEHYKNGAAKSVSTFDRYKRTVRMFKNARNFLESNGIINAVLAPSYFIESLLYNAPNATFQYGFQDTYCSIVKWMASTNLNELVCQNGQQYLFGPSPDQWSVAEARAFVNSLVALWEFWS